MKKQLHILDKISMGMIVLTIVSFVSTLVFKNTLYQINNAFDMVVAVLMMYTIFGVPGMTIIGMVLNTIALIKKNKKPINTTINIVLYIVFVLMLPIWWQFFWDAAMYI